jgi:hypothetical protein
LFKKVAKTRCGLDSRIYGKYTTFARILSTFQLCDAATGCVAKPRHSVHVGSSLQADSWKLFSFDDSEQESLLRGCAGKPASMADAQVDRRQKTFCSTMQQQILLKMGTAVLSCHFIIQNKENTVYFIKSNLICN